MTTTGQRYNLVAELFNTEIAYVSSLRTLAELYITPFANLSHSADDSQVIVTTADIPLIFSNVQVLSGLSSKLLTDMEQRIKTWSDQQIVGDILLSFIPFLKMYQQYITNHDDAALRVAHLNLTNERFRALCQRAQRDPRSQGRSLQDLLDLPMTRVPEIQRSVAGILQATPPSHPDCAYLHRAMKAIAEVSASMSDAVRKDQNRELIRSIEQKFLAPPNFLAPGRELLCQGDLVKKCRKSDKEYTFFLFNDMLAYATSLGGGWRYSLNRKLPIDASFRIEDVSDMNMTGWFYFKICSREKSFVVYASSAGAKANWMQDLHNCIEAQRAKGYMGVVGSKPAMQPDMERIDCPFCQQKFSLLRPRHHCGQCGSLACADCSKLKIVIPGRENEGPVRVCTRCGTQGPPQARLAVPMPNVDPWAPTGNRLRRSKGSRERRAVTAEGVEVPPPSALPNAQSLGLGRMGARAVPVNENGLEFRCERTAVMVNPSTRREFVSYTIRMLGHGCDFVVAKRYSQFADFDSKFRSHFPRIPYHIPPKIIFGHTDPLVVDERARAFVRYLSGISTVRALWKLLGEFMEVDENRWNSLRQAIDGAKGGRAADPVESPQPHTIRAASKPANLPPSLATSASQPIPIQRVGQKQPPPAVPARNYVKAHSGIHQVYQPSPPSQSSSVPQYSSQAASTSAGPGRQPDGTLSPRLYAPTPPTTPFTASVPPQQPSSVSGSYPANPIMASSYSQQPAPITAFIPPAPAIAPPPLPSHAHTAVGPSQPHTAAGPTGNSSFARMAQQRKSGIVSGSAGIHHVTPPTGAPVSITTASFLPRSYQQQPEANTRRRSHSAERNKNYMNPVLPAPVSSSMARTGAMLPIQRPAMPIAALTAASTPSTAISAKVTPILNFPSNAERKVAPFARQASAHGLASTQSPAPPSQGPKTIGGGSSIRGRGLSKEAPAAVGLTYANSQPHSMAGATPHHKWNHASTAASSEPAVGSSVQQRMAALAMSAAGKAPVVPGPITNSAPASAGLKARVLGRYDAQTESELSLTEGAMIFVLDRTDEQGWWYGKDNYGREGYLPASYVQLL